jgi:YbbR domain-containing protein
MDAKYIRAITMPRVITSILYNCLYLVVNNNNNRKANKKIYPRTHDSPALLAIMDEKILPMHHQAF